MIYWIGLEALLVCFNLEVHCREPVVCCCVFLDVYVHQIEYMFYSSDCVVVLYICDLCSVSL